MATTNITSQDIIHFWFEELDEAKWWKKDPEFDRLILSRFADLHARAQRCELYQWRDEPQGRLAEIIVLDQFPRNMYRGTPQAFASDPLALSLSQTAVAVGADRQLPWRQRNFLYMPYMHSESQVIHEQAVELFRGSGSFDFELRHKRIIDQFGRYPHRNAILERESTPEEVLFLQQPGSGF
jgi:uncharacterized protein (DUF924 family)